MVTIITGDKNVGKTTFLLHWQAIEGRGTGFCSRKTWGDGVFTGYELLFLPDRSPLPFIRPVGGGEADDPAQIIRNRFSFTRSVFSEAFQRIEAASVADNSQPVWIDEMGGLELSGEGFDSLFRFALTHFTDIRVVFRKRCLNELIAHYELNDYRVIDL